MDKKVTVKTSRNDMKEGCLVHQLYFAAVRHMAHSTGASDGGDDDPWVDWGDWNPQHSQEVHRVYVSNIRWLASKLVTWIVIL